jgi:hypothetical protein
MGFIPVQGPFSVAPWQTLESRFATFFVAVQERLRDQLAAARARTAEVETKLQAEVEAEREKKPLASPPWRESLVATAATREPPGGVEHVEEEPGSRGNGGASRAAEAEAADEGGFMAELMHSPGVRRAACHEDAGAVRRHGRCVPLTRCVTCMHGKGCEYIMLGCSVAPR